jgi:hypothetical protein
MIRQPAITLRQTMSFQAAAAEIFAASHSRQASHLRRSQVFRYWPDIFKIFDY